MEQRATKKWVVTTSQRGKPGPIQSDPPRQTGPALHLSLPPSTFPRRRTRLKLENPHFHQGSETLPFEYGESGAQRTGEQKRGDGAHAQHRGARVPALRNYLAAPTRVEGSGVSLEAEIRSSDQPETGREPAGMGGRRGLEGAELPRPPGFVCSLGPGRCLDLGVGGGCRRPEQGTPKPPLPRVAGVSDAREGRPLRHHHEAE